MKSIARIAFDTVFQLLILGIFTDAVWGVLQNYTEDRSSGVRTTAEAVLVLLMACGGVLGVRRSLREAGKASTPILRRWADTAVILATRRS